MTVECCLSAAYREPILVSLPLSVAGWSFHLLFIRRHHQNSKRPDVGFVVQNVTVQSVACATLVNVGSQLAANNHPGLATVLFGGSSVFGFLIYRGFKRVRRIDKFEKNIRG